MKDRRVRKTEQAIKSAFAKLLLEKDITDITICYMWYIWCT